MGISCVFTLIFYVLPLSLKLLIDDDDGDPTTHYSELMRVSVAISCNISSLTNIAIVLIRQDDITCHARQLLPECIYKSIYKYNKKTVGWIKTVSTPTVGLRKN